MIEFKYYAAGDLADWLEQTPRGGARDSNIHQGMVQVGGGQACRSAAFGVGAATTI
jgi:hypothetical protein